MYSKKIEVTEMLVLGIGLRIVRLAGAGTLGSGLIMIGRISVRVGLTSFPTVVLASSHNSGMMPPLHGYERDSSVAAEQLAFLVFLSSYPKPQSVQQLMMSSAEAVKRLAPFEAMQVRSEMTEAEATKRQEAF